MKKREEFIVLVFHSSVRSSWTEVLSGLYQYAHAEGWNVQVVEHACSRKSIEDLLAFWKPAGIFVEGGVDESCMFMPNLFGAVPTVYLSCDERYLPPGALRVNHDSMSIARAAARELLSLGLSSYAFFGFSGLFWSEERGRCFSEAMRLNGRTVHSFLRHLFESGEYVVDRSARDCFVKWLRNLPKPCGIFAANDLLAVETLSICHSIGLKVPEEIAVLGVDNDEIACENAIPTLSSIRPNFTDAGFLAAQLLGERMIQHAHFKGSTTRLFAADGVVRRQSTCRLPRSNAAIAKALEMIRLRACDGLLPRDVFPSLGCSRRLAEVRFRELTGHSIQDEILSVRLARVKELLRRPYIPIDTIATSCGWKSPARLRVFFREQEGVSMRDWRRRECEW